MFFEGSEKKFEIVIDNRVDLLSYDISFWKNLVAHSRAEIISQIENPKIKAFLLSESSLFVFKDKILMITCGNTILANALDYLIKEIGKDRIRSLIFQRKNEYFSRLQKTSFFDDIKILKDHFGNEHGKAFRLGLQDTHHNYLYQYQNHFKADPSDKTFEFLMYHISKNASDFLRKQNQTSEDVRKFLMLDKNFPGFVIDDFVFNPYGYSMNMIKDDRYATIHITPQEDSSYISFETNIEKELIVFNGVNGLMEALQPSCFDIIQYNFNGELNVSSNYLKVDQVIHEIDGGYTTKFYFYAKAIENPRSPVELV